VKDKQTIKIIKWRFWLVTLLFLIAIIVLFSRMVDLTLFKKGFLQQQGKSRTLRTIKTPAFRGMITDRNGAPLAVSTPVFSVWANPKDFSNSDQDIQVLSKLLGLSPGYLKKHFDLYQNKSFMYLKRNANPHIANRVKDAAIPGVYLQQQFKRYYPEGEVTSQLIGFTNIDDQGQEGLELAYNRWLTGKSGEQLVSKDLKGNVVAILQDMKQQEPGHDLTLSIDKRIQFLTYQALNEAVQHFKAESGSAVVLNVKTGEVLAMVNQPSFNPNDHSQGYSSNYRNRAITDVFEPGSTMKAFSIMSALDSGQYTPETIVDTKPGWLKVDHNWVHDEIDNGVIDVTQILQKSSNVGVAKMTTSLPGDQLWSVLNRVGFGQITASSFPGEQSGHLLLQNPWKPFALSTLAFGYAVSVTTLQLANAYAVIANDGIKVPVSLLKQDSSKSIKGERVLDSTVSNQMLTMLESVVASGGTGRRARVQGYRVAGKTGTARIAGPNGYQEDEHVGSFVGMAPVSDPELVVAVVITKPHGSAYFGGIVAAPAFADIMSGALRVMDIAPDALQES
jgi:cell division protein FtsI (penicillin-binding protein 3)